EDLAGPQRTPRQQAIEKADRVRPIDELVHDEVVADQDVVFHRGGRDGVGLREKRADEEGQDDGDERRLEGVPRPGAPRRRPRHRTSVNIRSHRVREKKWIATPSSWRILATGPRQMCEFGSASYDQ